MYEWMFKQFVDLLYCEIVDWSAVGLCACGFGLRIRWPLGLDWAAMMSRVATQLKRRCRSECLCCVSSASLGLLFFLWLVTEAGIKILYRLCLRFKEVLGTHRVDNTFLRRMAVPILFYIDDSRNLKYRKGHFRKELSATIKCRLWYFEFPRPI